MYREKEKYKQISVVDIIAVFAESKNLTIYWIVLKSG